MTPSKSDAAASAKAGRAEHGDVTTLLLAWRAGDQAALDRIIPVVHGELRKAARRHMAGERKAHTLQASALINEAYLRLVDAQQMNWRDRAHFLAMASRLMRRVLVDHARRRGYQKREGAAHKVQLDEESVSAPQAPEDWVAIDAALAALAKVDARKVQVVEMRFFGGLGVKEVAEALGVSPDTVIRDWKLAKAWLRHELARTSV